MTAFFYRGKLMVRFGQSKLDAVDIKLDIIAAPVLTLTMGRRILRSKRCFNARLELCLWAMKES
jgi:hypothetical protein